jgi:hypothetical protein
VFEKVRFLVITNLAATAVNAALFLLLIPAHGAVGAAIAMSATLVLHNFMKQAGLRLGTGVEVFAWRYLRVYVTVIGCISTLWLVQLTAAPPLGVGLALAAVASLLVVRVSRNQLRVAETFPELRRIPFASRLFPAPAAGGV